MTTSYFDYDVSEPDPENLDHELVQYEPPKGDLRDLFWDKDQDGNEISNT